jgi:hypothetical protein
VARGLVGVANIPLLGILLSTISAHGQTPKPDIQRVSLAWLAGSWSDHGEGYTNEEHWHIRSDGSLRGRSLLAQGGTPVYFVDLEITKTSKGIVYVMSRPSNSKAGRWRAELGLVQQKAQSVEFRSVTTDFPQRILYERKGAQLIIRSDRVLRGKKVSETLRLRRETPTRVFHR